MIIKSDITDCEYEVGIYDGGSGKYGVQHESLHDILINRLPETVSYNTKVITASVEYCAAECVISDLNGRKVQAFNDVSLPYGIFQDDKQKEFVSAHPLTQVIQSSEDTAVREYLGWPRYFMKKGAHGTTIGEVEIPPEAMKEHDEDTFTGMNPPEAPDEISESEKGSDETDPKPSDEKQPDSDSEPAPVKEPDKKEENDADYEYTIEELGAMKPPNGTYVNKTFDEIWSEKPSWFSYIANTSKNKKYDMARLYYKKKNEKPEN